MRTGRRGSAHALRAHRTARRRVGRRTRRPVRLLAAVARRGDLAVRRDPDAPMDGARAVGRRDPRARCDGCGRPSGGGSAIAYLAHVGGIAFAWLYMRTPPAASIERFRQRISPAPDYPQDETPRAIPRTLPRSRSGTQRDDVDEIVAKSKAVAAQQPRPMTRVWRRRVRAARGASGRAGPRARQDLAGGAREPDVRPNVPCSTRWRDGCEARGRYKERAPRTCRGQYRQAVLPAAAAGPEGTGTLSTYEQDTQ